MKQFNAAAGRAAPVELHALDAVFLRVVDAALGGIGVALMAAPLEVGWWVGGLRLGGELLFWLTIGDVGWRWGKAVIVEVLVGINLKHNPALRPEPEVRLVRVNGGRAVFNPPPPATMPNPTPLPVVVKGKLGYTARDLIAFIERGAAYNSFARRTFLPDGETKDVIERFEFPGGRKCSRRDYEALLSRLQEAGVLNEARQLRLPKEQIIAQLVGSGQAGNPAGGLPTRVNNGSEIPMAGHGSEGEGSDER